jgi:hypothetical protein
MTGRLIKTLFEDVAEEEAVAKLGPGSLFDRSEDSR